MTTPTVEAIRNKLLHELDPDFKTYTPDQGMSDTVWHLNNDQIDYIITSLTTAHEAELRSIKQHLVKCPILVGKELDAALSIVDQYLPQPPLSDVKE